MPESNAMTGFVLDIDRFSTHDGPGIRMAVFMKGCPLSCRWCHSPESQSAKQELLYQKSRCRACLSCVPVCPNTAVIPTENTAPSTPGGIKIDRAHCKKCFSCTRICHTQALRTAGTYKTIAEIAEIARRDKVYYDESGGGVTISGGEPLSQPAFVLALLRTLHEMRIHTAIETCGMGDETALLSIAAFTDWVYYDIKILDSEKHRRYTGMPNERILSNLRALSADPSLQGLICVRTPCIPGVNDTPVEIEAIARYIKALGIRHMELMPYNPVADAKYEWLGKPYPLEGTVASDPNWLDEHNKILKHHGLSHLSMEGRH